MKAKIAKAVKPKAKKKVPVDDLRQRYDKLFIRNTLLTVALKNLVDRTKSIDASDSFKTVFSVAYLHGAAYTGPNWSAEVLAAEAVLAGDK